MEDVKNLGKNSSKMGESYLSTRGLDIIISGAIALIFFMAPVFFTGLAAQGLGFEKMIIFYFLVLIGTVAWVTKGVISGELSIKRTPLDLPVLAMLVIFTVATILSVSTKDSLIGTYGNSAKSLVSAIIFALFYYLVVNNINRERIKLFFWSTVVSTILVICYSLLQLFGIFILPMPFSKIASFNPIGSLTGLTMLLVIILPLLVIGITQIREIAPKLPKALSVIIKIVLGIFGLASIVILALLNGFTFWPVAIVSIVIVLMFFMSKIIKISNNNLLIPLATFLALIIFLVLGNFNIINLNLPAEVSLSRSASWDIAKSALRQNPIFGSGPSTFYYDFSKFKNINFNSSPLWNVRFDSASGAGFELLATTGSLGALSFLILLLVAYSIAFLTLIKTQNSESNSILLALFAAFVSVGLFAALFALNNSLILIGVLIAVFSVAGSIVVYPEKFKTLKLSFRASPKYALALAAVFLGVSAGVVVLFTMGLKMYMADIYARKSLTDTDLGTKIADLNRAISLVPYQDVYYLSLANNYMAQANQEALSAGNQQAIQDALSLAINSGKRSVDIASEKAANNESLALIYENASFYTRGALEWAETYYNKVASLEPNNPAPALRIALINMARANVETDNKEKEYYINEAIKRYDESINKKSDLAAAHYGKAIAFEKLNKLDDAIDNLKKANLVAADNIDYRFELGRLYFNRGVAQPKISQTEAKQIAENEITPGQGTGDTTGENISVQPNQATGGTISRNNDLNTAEQIFLSILTVNPSHANALYSLAVLYQKIADNENARAMVEKLLNVLTDDATKNAVEEQFKGIL